jgi:hypothetical protein
MGATCDWSSDVCSSDLGFKNVGEMEKYFSRFCRKTPLDYRKENQVA